MYNLSVGLSQSQGVSIPIKALLLITSPEIQVKVTVDFTVRWPLIEEVSYIRGGC